MEIKKRVILITGATGLVGSYLIRELLRNKNISVICFVRKVNNFSYQRLIDSISFWESLYSDDYERLSVLEGDISKTNLGLNIKYWWDSLKKVDEIIHCAALTNYRSSQNELFNINVCGTRKILEFSEMLHKKGKLQKVSHMSTIYICGNSKIKFTEEKFDVGQKFNNIYEESKFEAEKTVLFFRKRGLWIDIFRLPAVLGDSLSGRIPNFHHAFYQGIRVLNTEIFSVLPCRGAEIDCGFVDDLSKAALFLIMKNKIRNNCFHLLPNKATSIENVLLLAVKQLNLHKPKFIEFSKFNKRVFTNIQLRILEYNYSLLPRKCKIDSSKTLKFLKCNNVFIKRPTKKYILKLLSYCVNKRFLKIKA